MTGGHPPSIAIGEFRIDLRRRQLLSSAGGEVIPLGSRPFEALAYLAQRPGMLVSRAELRAAVWPEVTVEDNSLSQCIAAVRRGLGEAPGQNRYIITEAGRGYRLVGAGAPPGQHGPATAVPRAFEAYVTGYSALARPGAGNLERGLADLERATRLDPDFALAHAGLAEAYALCGIFGLAAPRKVFPEARAAALRALAIAPELAEAHAALGHIKMMYDLDGDAAETSYAQALSFDPGSILAHHYMGLLRTTRGRFEEAILHLRMAQSREPLAANLSANIGQGHYYARRYHEAIAQLEQSLVLDPSFAHAQSLIGRCRVQLGQYDATLEVFASRAGRTVGSDGDIPATLAYAGRTDEARAGLERLLAESRQRFVSPYDLARIYMALGERQATLTALEAAVEESSQSISFVRYEPSFDSLHGEPRFQQVLRQLGAI